MRVASGAGPAYLFCPADRPERFAKAAAVADVVIVDLEDGVGSEHREAARRHVLAATLDPARTIVRVNPVGSIDHAADVDAVSRSAFDTVMLAKTASADEVLSLADFAVVALCETPEGIAAVDEIAACENTVGVMWGSEDLVAALGGYSSRHDDDSLRDVARYARARTLIAARSHHRIALDAAYLDFANLEGLSREATDAAAMGFTGTPCVHPTQIAVVRAAYFPTPAQVDWARRVLEAAAGRDGVFRLDGRMVDGPVVAQAHHILERTALT